MKTQEELQALTEEVKSFHTKLEELTEEELEQVIGGQNIPEQLIKRPLLPQTIFGGAVLYNMPGFVEDEKCVIVQTRDEDEKII